MFLGLLRAWISYESTMFRLITAQCKWPMPLCGHGEVLTMLGRDAIHLRGLEFYAYHGALPEEQVLGQRFLIDIDLFTDLSQAGFSDQVEDTIHYGEVYQVIKDCVRGERHQLLERLADDIAQRVLRKFSCTAVRLEVHKPQAPIPGICRDVSVEIWRERGERI